MRLFIAEKPDLARAIVQGLGGKSVKKEGWFQVGNDAVTWCFGHLLQLADPEDYDPSLAKWNMAQLPMVFRPWKHKPISDKKKQLQIIVKLIKQADLIVHAGDPDDEGQLLVDEILTYAKNKKPVKRLLINDNNTSVVKKALAKMRDNQEFLGLYQSALARSVADQMYGYNMTRGYTLAAQQKGFRGVLSVGRVQTPILGLVVARDRAHESHQQQFYYQLDGDFNFTQMNQQPLVFRARFQAPEDAPIDEKKRVIDRAYLDQIAQQCYSQPANIVKANNEIKYASAPLPYNLLNLQADASRKFNISPDQTLKITQNLRERHKLITYNRSDCEYLSNEQHGDASSVLSAIAATANVLNKAAKAADPSIKSRAFNSANVSAHHAIIPTATHGDFSKLTEQEKKVYQLIARAYLAQFFPKHQYRQTTIELDCQGHQFKTVEKITLKPGWLVLYKNDKDNDEVHRDKQSSKSKNPDLSSLQQNQQGFCQSLDLQQKETKPLARYTMATLLKDLARVAKYIRDPRLKKLLIEKDKDKKGEHGGIGTPATRSTIIKNLIDRDFICEKGKQVISTETGRDFFDVLPQAATAPDMTALWHEQQKAIQQGQDNIDHFLDGLVEYITTEIARIRSDGLDLKPSQIQATGKADPKNGPACPDCETGVLARRKGKKGFFWGCSRYPECKAIYPDSRGKAKLTKFEKPVLSNHLCKACQKPLIRRKGKKKASWFWGCSGYPECKQTYFDKAGDPDFS
ncbi:DNA topoisomerase 3 [Pelagibaculum spongiae]|uniref:DNA topoisomerase n=1 Tax=Pelagibaculum spongiae TaxID=2080658 RepID=A0A2V1H6M3_9GAMM|nr:DNA topoisomerase 3 [Pelagibaculum spongiae]PVZ72082.1 DNA topoisomerase III [Pelagibaculum spongiae]